MLVIGRSHMMFRLEFIYLFDLIINLMVRKLNLDVWFLKKSLHKPTTDWIAWNHACLQRSHNLPLEGLKNKKNNKLKKNDVQRIKDQLRHDINGKTVSELQWIGWNPSMMRIHYKLTEKTKTEKYRKSLTTNNIMNFNTIRYKLTALGNIIHLILT